MPLLHRTGVGRVRMPGPGPAALPWPHLVA